MSHHLLGPAEVADILGVSRQRVAQLAAASLDFPEPEVELAAGRIWSRESIEAWVAAHPERVKSQDPRTQCSFCLKQEEQVERIISGPGVYICNECVDEAGAAVLAQGPDNALPKLSGLFHSELNLPEELGRELERLDPLQRRVLTLRFGLDRGEPRTIGEVAGHLRLEAAEVRQIEATALSRLRPQP